LGNGEGCQRREVNPWAARIQSSQEPFTQPGPTPSVELVGYSLHIALLVNGFAVFIGNKISLQID
jgi:hypothetical protein